MNVSTERKRAESASIKKNFSASLRKRNSGYANPAFAEFQKESSLKNLFYAAIVARDS